MNAYLLEDDCHGLGPLVKIVYKVVRILWMLIPIALILFGIIDLGRAVISSDDKEIAGAKTKLLQRVLYAVAVFLVVWLVSVLMTWVASIDNGDIEGTNDWKACWKYVRETN